MTARRRLVEVTPREDVRELRRRGFVRVGDVAWFARNSAGALVEVELAHLERPVFGGHRTYFKCPNCGGHADLLYHVGEKLACWRCQPLTYACRRETPMTRRISQIEKRRRRLGQAGWGILDPLPPRRRWMRWATYIRQVRQTRERERAHWMAVAKTLGLVDSDKPKSSS